MTRSKDSKMVSAAPSSSANYSQVLSGTRALQEQQSQIPLIRWEPPSRFTLNSDWQVATGEESSEIIAQQMREMRVLEAVYPQPSDIPPNPTLIAGESIPNDHNTPMIPIIGIEEEVSVQGGQTTKTDRIMITLTAAARGALSDLVAQNCSPNLIDYGLLHQILGQPQIRELIRTRLGLSSMPATHTVPPPPTPSTSLSLPTTNVSTPQTISLAPSASSPKKKPCRYFNTSRGCWNGSNCLFEHSGGQRASGSDVHSAKRVKRG